MGKQTDFLDKIASLTPFSRRIVCDKATEPPFTEGRDSKAVSGSYLCRRCGLALFRGLSRFDSGCGWPSFDERISNTVRELADEDGIRTEIRCCRCDAHLGHVFTGEHFTKKNCRYCVNAAAIDFVTSLNVMDTEEAILAGGCFWGVEYYLSQLSSVLKVEVGYTGGVVEFPSYEQVCLGNSGHYEAVRVVYDVDQTDYQTIVKRFFEIHDPTQVDGQGPDIGSQYQSVVFCYTQAQQNVVKTLISSLKNKGYPVVTRILPVQVFWPAEDYHQHYYVNHQKMPYCHYPVARFD